MCFTWWIEVKYYSSAEVMPWFFDGDDKHCVRVNVVHESG